MLVASQTGRMLSKPFEQAQLSAPIYSTFTDPHIHTWLQTHPNKHARVIMRRHILSYARVENTHVADWQASCFPP